LVHRLSSVKGGASDEEATEEGDGGVRVDVPVRWSGTDDERDVSLGGDDDVHLQRERVADADESGQRDLILDEGQKTKDERRMQQGGVKIRREKESGLRKGHSSGFWLLSSWLEMEVP
jgi:hypothetical protein